mmetsp:Transcript_37513/g.118269  ORF Transcript_37513/g.118269 Transcript_37513/m.118269 type:complete len:219 (+) Transcript_37513:462-1118(+)
MSCPLTATRRLRTPPTTAAGSLGSPSTRARATATPVGRGLNESPEIFTSGETAGPAPASAEPASEETLGPNMTLAPESGRAYTVSASPSSPCPPPPRGMNFSTTTVMRPLGSASTTVSPGSMRAAVTSAILALPAAADARTSPPAGGASPAPPPGEDSIEATSEAKASTQASARAGVRAAPLCPVGPRPSGEGARASTIATARSPAQDEQSARAALGL